jgi:hypothetical protein
MSTTNLPLSGELARQLGDAARAQQKEPAELKEDVMTNHTRISSSSGASPKRLLRFIRRCLPAGNSINTGYRNKGLDKSSGLCHC